MVLACNNICKSFGSNVILDNCSFHIEDGEKAAIVGINGAGKTTLFKIIIGEMGKDSGDVFISNGKTLGYLSQHQDLNSDLSIYEEILTAKKEIIELESEIHDLELKMKNVQGLELEKILNNYNRLTQKFEHENGFAYKSEVIGVIKGLGFNEEDFDKPVGSLSGGQKTRVSLGKLLLLSPDILMLDEPINHLDIQSVNWLENYLINYKGSVIIIAHDRYFLDRVVTKVIEIENSKATTFKGNYTDFYEKKGKLIESKINQYYNQQKEIKRQEDVITKLKSFNREKSIKRAESREKLLSKIDVLDKPIETMKQMSLTLEPLIISGKDVIAIKDLEMIFDDNLLFSNVDFEIKRGERIAIIGDNGTGKTTLLKIIKDEIKDYQGEIVKGSKVNIGYYDQEQKILNPDNTIFDEIRSAFPSLDNTKIEMFLPPSCLLMMRFIKRTDDLSGGERGRVSLAKLMLSEANFLILDQPTNHLDIMSKEILENALNNYSGTILYVSHDRFFINRTATRILELYNKKMVNYIGNYDYYLDKKDILRSDIENEESLKEEFNIEGSTKLDWELQKAEQAKERKRQSDLKKTEDSIYELEGKIEKMEELLLLEENFSDSQKLLEIHNKKEKIHEKLVFLYEKWENLM